MRRNLQHTLDARNIISNQSSYSFEKAPLHWIIALLPFWALLYSNRISYIFLRLNLSCLLFDYDLGRSL